ncbi:MAG: CRISPR-associated protein Csx11 [Acidimicrobiia bacterium]|nr:MAG: CRISPR-associated protein Csx11 [Acidimicrobiia bacterium]
MTCSGADMAKVLREHRPLLLGCEAIGWLHMAGKAHPDFLRSHGGTGVSYDEKQWHEQLDPSWSDRLDWLRTANSLTWPASLVEFVRRYNEGRSVQNLVGCLQAGHAMASGIEKNIPREPISTYLEQDATHMWLATAFGHPVRNLLADPPDVLRPGGWQELLQQIGALLDELKELGTNPPDAVQPWWAWREEAIGEHGWLRRAFESTLAETRLPNNDVTLWDQSYVAAALFKSAVAGIVLLQNLPADVWQNLKSQTRWRVLTVGFGTDHYEARAVRIGDWTGAQMQIERFFDDVRRLIEVDLAVGSLLYRDDQVLAFTFPGERFDDEGERKGRSLGDEAANRLREWIEQQVDELAQNRKFETPPSCNLSTSTRSVISMAREAAKARDRVAVSVHRTWPIAETTEQQGHICPVCQVRFSAGRHGGEEANPKQRPCNVCRERRKGRLDAWLKEGADTIWITELADDNDRVALLTFGFDLEPWLDGSRVDSLRAQSIAAWRRFNPVLYKNPRKQDPVDNPIDPGEAREELLAHVQGSLAKDWNEANQDVVLRGLQDGVQHDSSWESLYDKIVWDRADAPSWNETEGQDDVRARWLLHQLFRKNASPGRVYRFWRTAEGFFDELLPIFREAVAAHANRWRTRRLVLEPTGDSATGWQDRETYSTRWNDAPLELLYRAGSNDFLTVCNVARVLRPEQRREDLRGIEWQMKGDDGRTRTLKVGSVSEPAGLGAYAPLIVLDRSPVRFRVLVPLSAAGPCVDAAVAKWGEEFGRVWDRMPLHVGIVAFPRMTPFQAVIEAARNVEADLSRGGKERWRVVESHVRDGVAALVLARPDGAHELVTAPIALPDGRADDHYPYVAVTDRIERHSRDFTRPASTDREAQLYRHVADLAPGDGVAVAPSRLAIVFLDSTARRFESAELRYLSEWRRLWEIWDLLCRTAPSVTALRGAWGALADARERWNAGEVTSRDGSAAWASLARSVLANHLEARPPELDALVDAAVSGILGTTLEWHLRILKLDLEVRT